MSAAFFASAALASAPDLAASALALRPCFSSSSAALASAFAFASSAFASALAFASWSRGSESIFFLASASALAFARAIIVGVGGRGWEPLSQLPCGTSGSSRRQRCSAPLVELQLGVPPSLRLLSRHSRPNAARKSRSRELDGRTHDAVTECCGCRVVEREPNSAMEAMI